MAAGRRLSVQEVLTLLRGTPGRISEAVADAEPAQLVRGPSPKEWSPVEVLAHLRACADVWGNCIEKILAEDEPTIRAVNPTTWVLTTDYTTLGFQDSLSAFTNQRVDLLSTLDRLEPERWERGATVTGAGRPLWRTVHDYAQWLARHEQPHVKQISKAVVSGAK